MIHLPVPNFEGPSAQREALPMPIETASRIGALSVKDVLKSPWVLITVGSVVVFSATTVITDQIVDRNNVPPISIVEVGPNAQAQVVVFPVDIEAGGFKPLEVTDETMAKTVRESWATLNKATNSSLTPHVTVTVEPRKKVAIPSITSIPDFCQNDPVRTLRAAMVQESLQDYDLGNAIPVFVTESPCGGSANGGPSSGVTILGSSHMNTAVMSHELGHVLGLGHGNRVICKEPQVPKIGRHCKTLEYHDAFTGMGPHGLFESDKDPLTGVALRRLKAIPPSDVFELAEGSSRFELSALNNHGGFRLARVPIEQTTIQFGDSPETRTINEVYFELSSTTFGTPKDRPLSLKVYGIDTTEPHILTSHLLPVRGHVEFDNWGIGQEFDFAIGGRRISFIMNSLVATGRNATGSAHLSVDVQKVPLV